MPHKNRYGGEVALCNYPSGLVYPGLPDRVTYDLATRPYVSWRASAPTRASRTLAPERESNLEDDDTILADPGHRPKMVLDAGFDMHGNSATPHPHPRPPTHPPTTTHPPTHPTPPHPTPPRPTRVESTLRKTVAFSLPNNGWRALTCARPRSEQNWKCISENGGRFPTEKR